MTLFAAAMVLWQAPASPSGLARVLDRRARTYSVHLEVDDDGIKATSDYNIEFTSPRPKKEPKSKLAPEKPKPGVMLMRLTDLRWSAGTLHRREELFGSGDLTFEEAGFPSEFLDRNWILSPLLGFYVPGSGVDLSKELPLGDLEVGVGWKIDGKARLEVLAKDVRESVAATLTRGDGAKYSVTGQSVFDPKTGWPRECHGTIENDTVTVTFAARLR